MNRDKAAMLILSFMAGVVAGSLIMLIAVGQDRKHFEREAVEAGKAEYYLDDKHERQWRWKP